MLSTCDEKKNPISNHTLAGLMKAADPSINRLLHIDSLVMDVMDGTECWTPSRCVLDFFQIILLIIIISKLE